MDAEVYRWFTGTSGLGFMGQAAKLMGPKSAAKEADVAEAIEQWEEKMKRLARHAEGYQLNESFKKVASKRYLWARSWTTSSSLTSNSSRSRSSSSGQDKEAGEIRIPGTDWGGRRESEGHGPGGQPATPVPSFGRQDQESTNMNALKGKGPAWGQQNKGKSNGKGKGMHHK